MNGAGTFLHTEFVVVIIIAEIVFRSVEFIKFTKAYARPMGNRLK